MDTHGSLPPSSLPPYEQPTQPLRQLQRTWPALLTLYFLSPMIGEILSGSTPVLSFIQPVSIIYQPALYGSGAILVRELVRRRGLGWGSILLLGAAYGILEEGLVVTSWFNPYWPGLSILAHYGRFLDTSWVWAVELTVYHAVVSISIPIMLVELLFPQIADRPWLGKRGFRAFIILLTITSLLGLFLFGFVMSSKQGYTHPPLMYIGALLLAAGLVWLGLHLPKRSLSTSVGTVTAPGLWRLRFFAFLATIAFFLASWAIPNMVPIPIVPVLAIVGLVAAGIWSINRWANRAGWNVRHRLALASGVLFFFVLLSPIIEFFTRGAGRITTGQTLFGLFALGVLIFLAWWVKRRVDVSLISAG
jgi:hypothetical protein